jgi:hypothetical protein
MNLRLGLRFFHAFNTRLNIPPLKSLVHFNFLANQNIKNLPKETIICVAREYLKDAFKEIQHENIKAALPIFGDSISHFHFALSRYMKKHERLEEATIDFTSKKDVSNVIECLDKLICSLKRENIRWGKFNGDLDYNSLQEYKDICKKQLITTIQDLTLIYNTLENKNDNVQMPEMRTHL